MSGIAEQISHDPGGEVEFWRRKGNREESELRTMKSKKHLALS